MNLEKYKTKAEWRNSLYNTPNSFILGLREDQFENLTEIKTFIESTEREFSHLTIVEHYDESLIVMRRKLCWEISDILYLPLRIGNYSREQRNHRGSNGILLFFQKI